MFLLVILVLPKGADLKHDIVGQVRLGLLFFFVQEKFNYSFYYILQSFYYSRQECE